MASAANLTASEARQQIEAGRLTSTKLVQDCLDRIAAREPEVQAWVAQSRETLAGWGMELRDMLIRNDWTCAPSDTPYLCARPSRSLDADAMRAQGVKLRDATSFGLPGWWRLSAQRPETLAALKDALQRKEAFA